MANKALAKRQKMTIRTEPTQKAPRDPVAVPARQRAAGAHRKTVSAQRQLLQRLLGKVTGEDA
jgi:hypothetical protein